MVLNRIPHHYRSLKFPLASTSIQSVQFYHQLHRSVAVSFSPKNRTKGRKLKLLDLAVTFGPVQNLFDGPDGNTYLVGDVHNAKQFKDAVTRSLKTVQVSFGTKVNHTIGGIAPGPSAVGRIWGGMSRSVRFDPERPGEVTEQDIWRECKRLGLQVATVWNWKTHFEITFYRFHDPMSVGFPRESGDTRLKFSWMRIMIWSRLSVIPASIYQGRRLTCPLSITLIPIRKH